jgi:hypothetical protein
VFAAAGGQAEIITVVLAVKGVEHDADDVVGAIALVLLHRVGANTRQTRRIVAAHRHIDVVGVKGDPELGALGRLAVFHRIDLPEGIRVSGGGPRDVIEDAVDQRRCPYGPHVKGGRGNSWREQGGRAEQQG